MYDAAYEGLRGIQRIRSITSRLYLDCFPLGSRLLELNCGTGNDALFLARQGMNILATDLSAKMLEEVARKIDGNDLRNAIQTRQLPFDQLGDLRGTLFDGAYSNLGGLNCTDRICDVAAHLGTLIRPGGHFIAAVMPPFCLWESGAFLLRLRWRDAVRRFSRRGTIASLHGGSVHTYYFSPRFFRAAFAPYFEHVKTVGLSIFTPPPNFERAYARLGSTVRLLERLDDLLCQLPPFHAIGDHYAIVLKRKAL